MEKNYRLESYKMADFFAGKKPFAVSGTCTEDDAIMLRTEIMRANTDLYVRMVKVEG
jgi:hypothetical protein